MKMKEVYKEIEKLYKENITCRDETMLGICLGLKELKKRLEKSEKE